MSKVGYARVSSTGQKLDVQLEKLKKVGCEKIFSDKASGVTAQRIEFQECMRYLREGDILYVSRLDRLARSTLHLHQIIEDLESRSIQFHCIDQQICTDTPTGRLLYSMLSAISQFENELRAERQADGIRKAMERGVKFGRKSKLSNDQIEEMRQKRSTGILIKDLMKEYGLSKASVYRLLSTAE